MGHIRTDFSRRQRLRTVDRVTCWLGGVTLLWLVILPVAPFRGETRVYPSAAALTVSSVALGLLSGSIQGVKGALMGALLGLTLPVWAFWTLFVLWFSDLWVPLKAHAIIWVPGVLLTIGLGLAWSRKEIWTFGFGGTLLATLISEATLYFGLVILHAALLLGLRSACRATIRDWVVESTGFCLKCGHDCRSLLAAAPTDQSSADIQVIRCPECAGYLPSAKLMADLSTRSPMSHGASTSERE